MRKIIATTCLVFLTAVFFLSSCSEDETAPIPLKANAGPDQTVAPFTTVALDGSASIGPEFNSNFSWEQTSGPQNIYLEADPSNPNDQRKRIFEPQVNGIYQFRIRITNQNEFSEDQVTITVTGALELSGTLTKSITLMDIEPNSGLPDYIITSNLTIPDGIMLESNNGITIKVANNTGIIVQAGGKLRTLGGKLTADTGWKGILVDGGTLDLTGGIIEKAGATMFEGQTEAAAITLVGSGVHIDAFQNVQITETAAYGILVTGGLSTYYQDVIHNNSFPTKYIKAPISFVSAIGVNSSDGFVHLSTGGNGIIEALPYGAVFRFANSTYYIDNDFIAGSQVIVQNATVLMKAGAGILVQNPLTIQSSTIKGLDNANWKGIAIAASGSGNSAISSSTIENAGSDVFNTGFFSTPVKAAVYYSSGGLSTFNNSTIKNSGGYGIYNDSPSFFTFQGSTFSGTTLAAIREKTDRIHVIIGTDNTFTMLAGVPAVEVFVPNINTYPQATWKALGGSNYYLLSNNMTSSYAWTLDPGVNLKFKAGKSLNLYDGTFTAIGTALAPITFNSEVGTAATWAGIMVQTRVNMQFCEINNGGEVKLFKTMVTQATDLANIVFDYGAGANTHVFKNNTVKGSGGYGVSIEATKQNPDVMNVADNNTFSGNTSGDTKIN